MDNIIDQLGITREEIIDIIVNKALGEKAKSLSDEFDPENGDSWENFPYLEDVDKQIREIIRTYIKNRTEGIENQINKIMEEEIDKVFKLSYQPVNQWGEKLGGITTIRDVIANEATKYWSVIVNDRGEPASYLSGCDMSRAHYHAKKVIKDHYDKELVTVVKKMAEEFKNMIPATIASEITNTVIKYLK